MSIHRIPNAFVLSLTLVWYAAALALGWSMETITERTVLALVVLALGVAAFIGGFRQGGTMKLLAVAFLWLGFEDGCTFTMISMVLAAIAGKVSEARGSGDTVPYMPFAAIALGVMYVPTLL